MDLCIFERKQCTLFCLNLFVKCENRNYLISKTYIFRLRKMGCIHLLENLKGIPKLLLT